jgi:signal transduction histidine kinase
VSGGPHPSDQLRQWQALQLSKIELDLQQQALTALQESTDQAQAGQALYQQLFELSPACSYALDAAGRVVSVNQAGAALLGQSAAALKGQPFERYLAPEEQPAWRAFAAILHTSAGTAGMESQLFGGIPGAGAVRIEARLDAASGLCCVVLAPAAPTPAAPTPAAAQAADRTAALERDNAQLRLLGEHEATMLEAERQDMARAVHDGVAQNLLALRLDAALLNKRSLAHHGPLRERSGAALDNIDATLRSVRAILNRLRPAVLELGLQATLDWQLAEFRKHSGLACTLDVQDEQVFDCLDGVASLMLFRQLQAVLESVQRDGGASAVAVSLRRNGGSGVQLMLTDDGAGDGGGVPVAGRRQRQALAMLGVGERLRAHGGTLDVAYGTGQGCRVSMRLPGRNS